MTLKTYFFPPKNQFFLAWATWVGPHHIFRALCSWKLSPFICKYIHEGVVPLWYIQSYCPWHTEWNIPSVLCFNIVLFVVYLIFLCDLMCTVHFADKKWFLIVLIVMIKNLFDIILYWVDYFSQSIASSASTLAASKLYLYF